MYRRDVMCRAVSALFLILTLALPISAQEDRGWSNRGKVKASASETVESPETTLRALIRAGRIDDLRWPDFSDYRAEVEEFYSRSHYALAWFRGGQATSQAFQMIDILQQAESEGLRAEDYDSSRWTERLVRLQRQHYR